MRIDLQIGGYTIRLDEPETHLCLDWPFATFDPFVAVSGQTPDIAVTVRVVQRLPEVRHGPVLYDACHGLWKWHAADAGYLLESANRSTGEPEALALVSKDITSAAIWVLAQPTPGGKRMGWMPMHIMNPIVEACLVTRLATDGGLLLHAAGLLTNHGGFVFTGASGAGKSTISDFYAARGAHVLSDERVILRIMGGAVYVFGTPWAGTGRQATNAAGPLTALYCIRHGEGAHALRKISSRDFSLFVLRQCFLPHWDRAAMDRTLAFLSELIEQTGCFELAFMKSPDIVDYLEEQRLEHPVALS